MNPNEENGWIMTWPLIALHSNVAGNSSKNRLNKKVRAAFPEWDGRSIDISIHKGWGSICKYLLKGDNNPVGWGEYSLETIRQIAKAHNGHRESKSLKGNANLVKRLEELDDWYQVYRDETFQDKLLTLLPRMRDAFDDFQTLKSIEGNIFERIVSYLDKSGWPEEYSVVDLKEKDLVLDWLACQLCFTRPLKTKQLFLYGTPSTVTYFFPFVRIDFALRVPGKMTLQMRMITMIFGLSTSSMSILKRIQRVALLVVWWLHCGRYALRK